MDLFDALFDTLFLMLKGEEPGPIKKFLHYQDKGQFGEYLTEYALTNNNITGVFRLYKNVYVPHDGKTSEIDLLLIHEKGIFVIECKNYSGWIFGDREHPNWTQVLSNKQKNHFYNPVWQNDVHVKALAAYLGMEESAFTSYIVFSRRCELKKIPEDMDATVVMKRPQMLKILRKALDGRSVRYSGETLAKIDEKLAACINKTAEEKQQHIARIRQEQKAAVCPSCGKRLVERKGKYGAFLGCSGYPKCRYTRQIDG